MFNFDAWEEAVEDGKRCGGASGVDSEEGEIHAEGHKHSLARTWLNPECLALASCDGCTDRMCLCELCKAFSGICDEEYKGGSCKAIDI